MATTTIPWGDGSGGNIYLTYPSASGDQTVSVSSDANTGAARTKVVTFAAGNVTQTLTVNQKGVPQQYTVTFDIVGYDTSDHSWYSQSNIANAYAGSDNTTYAQINYTRGSNAETWVYFKFDTSSIPADATIDSVSCVIKCLTNGNATILPTRTVQMFTGTTAKGSASSMPTSAGTRTLSGETWTVAELHDARVKVYAKRGTTQTTTNYYCRIYGATLTITYIA